LSDIKSALRDINDSMYEEEQEEESDFSENNLVEYV
jgi:hypothetical protein